MDGSLARRGEDASAHTKSMNSLQRTENINAEVTYAIHTNAHLGNTVSPFTRAVRAEKMETTGSRAADAVSLHKADKPVFTRNRTDARSMFVGVTVFSFAITIS